MKTRDWDGSDVYAGAFGEEGTAEVPPSEDGVEILSYVSKYKCLYSNYL